MVSRMVAGSVVARDMGLGLVAVWVYKNIEGTFEECKNYFLDRGDAALCDGLSPSGRCVAGDRQRSSAVVGSSPDSRPRGAALGDAGRTPCTRIETGWGKSHQSLRR
jgi:hypothetical protein